MSKSPTGRKVFITNLGYHNYEGAKRFGDLVVLTRGRVDLFHTDRLAGEILTKLESAEAEDYLLASGSPLITGICAAALVKRFGVVNFLYWDPLYQDYILRPFDAETMLIGVEEDEAHLGS